MKRFFSLFLLLSYLLSSPGLVYSMHFCGPALTEVSVAKEAACCCPVPKKPTGCCHDQKVTSTVKDVKLTAGQRQVTAPDVVPAPPVLYVLQRLSRTYPAEEPAVRRLSLAAPPPECPVYVRGHAFLI